MLIPFQIHRRIPLLRRPFYQRDRALAERDQAAAKLVELQSEIVMLTKQTAMFREFADYDAAERDQAAAKLVELQSEIVMLTKQTAMFREFADYDATVLQYRQAYFEVHGRGAPGLALPRARIWPPQDRALSYKEKLTGLLPINDGTGAELGPLDIPLLSKDEAHILYVDHLDTAGLRAKYPTLKNIAEVDRPMINDSLEDTLKSDSPLDYMIASHVFEHVPNPVRWLREAAAVLRPGGLMALALPDRRMTFDFFRKESSPSDIVSAYIADATVPDARSVYDCHSQAGYISTPWAGISVSTEEIISGRGSVKPQHATDDYVRLAQSAKDGAYLDVHAWVYTPWSLLMVMAQLAIDGFLPFALKQFYPTDSNSPDRGSSSIIAILEKVDEAVPRHELRRSYLSPLGEE
jgi:SAM-dependent methyltransferase